MSNGVKKYLDLVGLKYLWMKIKEKTDYITYEHISLEILNNGVPINGNVSIIYGLDINDPISSLGPFSYNGEPLSFKVPAGNIYKIVFGSNLGDTIIYGPYIANYGGLRDLTLEYNSAELTMNVTGLTDNTNASVNTYAMGRSANVSNNETISVPYNAPVTITAPEIEGYSTPIIPETSYNSDEVVNINYTKLTYDVFIVDINGNRYTANEWTTKIIVDKTTEVLGVAVSNGKYVKLLAPVSYAWWSNPMHYINEKYNCNISSNKLFGVYDSDGNESLVNELFKSNIGSQMINNNDSHTMNEFLNLYNDGLGATDEIYNITHDESGVNYDKYSSWLYESNGYEYRGNFIPAVEYCKNFQLGGITEGWHLPSYNEWNNFFISNMDAVNECMQAISGVSLTDYLISIKNSYNISCGYASSSYDIVNSNEIIGLNPLIINPQYYDGMWGISQLEGESVVLPVLNWSYNMI